MAGEYLDPKLYANWLKNADILLNESFESGRLSSNWRREDSPDQPHSLNIVDNPTGRSSKALRVEVRKSDPLASGSYRSELSAPIEPVGSEMLYEFSTLLPSTWKNDPANEIISQWHGAPDTSKEGETWSGSPPLSIQIDGNEMFIKTNWNTGSGYKSKILWRGDYEKGSWTDWIVWAKWFNSSKGVIQVWKNNQLIVDHQGPNTHYNQSRGIYFKTGIYKYSWKRNPASSNTTARVMYVDDVRVADVGA
jgi:hypothetical protein